MLDWITGLFASGNFIPHGYCLAWNPLLLWTLVISHLLIGVAYFSIPVTLMYFLRLQKSLAFNWIFVLFAGFILTCGAGHFLNVLDIWRPQYQIEALLMAVTAVISVVAAIALWVMVPRISAYIDRSLDAHRRLNDSMAVAELRNAQLEESEKRFRLTLDNAPIGLSLVSLEGRWISVNRALCAMLGYSEPELLSMTFQQITHPEDLNDDLGNVIDLINGKADSYRMNKRYFHKQGHVIHAQLDVVIVRSPSKIPLYFVSQIQDVSKELELLNQLSYQARHDPITSLPNRLDFDETLKACCENPEQPPHAGYLLYLDLDHFKVINDTCGHTAGDKLLREMPLVLKSALRPQDYLARLGGDEFGVILKQVSAETACATAQRLINAVDEYHLHYSNQTFKVSLSVGISAMQASNGNCAMTLTQADTACYIAKSLGRGRYQMYKVDDADIQQAEQTLSWAQRIQKAFEGSKFEVYLQSIISRDKELVGYEALIRMRDTDNGIVLPNDFLPSAQRMNWMTRLDQWMVTEVLKIISNRQHPAETYISVNLSAKSVSDPAFTQWLIGALDSNWTPNESVRFEITETEYLQTTAVEINFLKELRGRGYRVSLDDFGSGYNSFNLLKRLKVDGLKIDSSFTRDLLRDPVDRALIEAIASIGQAMNIEVTAEGVEDEETYRILHKMGIGAFQGYLFHRAEPAGRAIARRYIH